MMVTHPPDSDKIREALNAFNDSVRKSQKQEQKPSKLEAPVVSLVCNLYGGPGAGKSTTASELFGILKRNGVVCELAPEYAKDLVWERRFHQMDDQIRIFAEQRHRVLRCIGQVDVIINDSPLLLSLVYGRGYSDSFRALVREEHHKLNNIDFFIKRNKAYHQGGRVENEGRAKDLDTRILTMLRDEHVDYVDCTDGPQLAYHIFTYVKEKLQKNT